MPAAHVGRHDSIGMGWRVSNGMEGCHEGDQIKRALWHGAVRSDGAQKKYSYEYTLHFQESGHLRLLTLSSFVSSFDRSFRPHVDYFLCPATRPYDRLLGSLTRIVRHVSLQNLITGCQHCQYIDSIYLRIIKSRPVMYSDFLLTIFFKHA